MHCVRSLEQIALLVQTGIIYSQTMISMKLMKFTLLYTATMMGGKQLLGKSYVLGAKNKILLTNVLH